MSRTDGGLTENSAGTYISAAKANVIAPARSYRSTVDSAVGVTVIVRLGISRRPTLRSRRRLTNRLAIAGPSIGQASTTHWPSLVPPQRVLTGTAALGEALWAARLGMVSAGTVSTTLPTVEMVRWGIIGVGNVTEGKSGPGFQQAERSELVAVMRRKSDLALSTSALPSSICWTGYSVR
jgi:hypothetical protein